MKWRSGALLLGVLAVAACTGPTASATHSPTPQAPSPSPIPTPVASPSPIFDSPSPIPPPPTPLADILRCRIPVSNGQPGSGGFVVFPGGKFVADTTSNVVVTGIPSPSPSQYGYGYATFFGLSYDRKFRKWLPVTRTMVTPDETHYVYPTSDGIYVVNVAGGAPTEIDSTSGHPWTIMDVETEGLYGNPNLASPQAVAGLWLVPFTGAARHITTKGYWQLVGRGFAYGFQSPSVPSGATQALLRLDLKTGAITPWYDSIPQYPNLLGPDLKGRPIFLSQTTGQQVLILTGSNQAITIYDSQVTGSGTNIYIQSAFADANGLWLALNDGMYLSKSGTAPIEKVSNVSGPIAGPCV